MRLTLEDIGRLAGVSRSTVSRVINDQNSVSPAVRERVHDVIRRTGFSPNVAARSLAARRTGVIGLVIPSRVHSLFEDPYFGLLIKSISSAGNAAQQTLALFLFETEEEEEDVYPRALASGLVDGVILTASRMGDPVLARLVEGSLPFVMVGRPDRDDSQISYVDVDNVGGAFAAAVHLCNLGYRRIAYVGGPTSTTSGLDRLAGFGDGLATCGVPLSPSLRADGDYSQRSGYEAMRSLLPQRPDAVFVASDTMAFGALQALRDAGVSVPQDVAVVGFDGLPAAQHSVPALTTVRQSVAGTGSHAVRILLDLVSGQEPGPVAEVLPTELVVRESCGAARSAAGAEGG